MLQVEYKRTEEDDDDPTLPSLDGQELPSAPEPESKR
jgi:hypothetical protein